MSRSKNGHLMRWLHGDKGSPWRGTPADFCPRSVERTLDLLDPVFGPNTYLPTEVHGWENIPRSPVLFVSNHSGGTLIPDVWGFLHAWYRHHGTSRPLHPLGHDLLFANRHVGQFFAKRGVVPAHRESGLEVLREWKRDLIVFPGGDRDTWRPYDARYKVSFGGRKGYARFALESGATIIPVAHAGAHETLRVISSGRRIAKALRFKQLFRAEIMPIHLSIPWGLTIGPWPHIPLPTQFRYRIGKPVELPAHDGELSPSLIDEVDTRVRDALQSELTALETGVSPEPLSPLRDPTPIRRSATRARPAAAPSDTPAVQLPVA